MSSDTRILVVVLLVTLALVGVASGTAVAGSVGSDQCAQSIGGGDVVGSDSEVGTECGYGGGGGGGWCDDFWC